MDHYVALRLSDVLAHYDEAFSRLDEGRAKKAKRYVRLEDRARSVASGLLIRAYAGKGLLIEGEYGKISLQNGPEFNVSHGGEFIVIYVCSHPVGVDVESIARCDLKIVPVAMTEVEANDIHTPKDLAYAWTRKEAVAKCLGRGIEDPSHVGLVRRSPTLYLYKEKEYSVSSLELEGHVFAVASEASASFVPLHIASLEEVLRQLK